MNLHKIDSSVTTSTPFFKRRPLNLRLYIKGKWVLWRHMSVCFILQLVPRQPVALIGVLLIQKSLDEPTHFVLRSEAVRSSALPMCFCMSVWWQMRTAFRSRPCGFQHVSVLLTLFNKPLKSVLYCALVIQSCQYIAVLFLMILHQYCRSLDRFIYGFYTRIVSFYFKTICRVTCSVMLRTEMAIERQTFRAPCFNTAFYLFHSKLTANIFDT